jgi:23S rRNA (uracil747-C5)-methyltransferase
MLHCEIFASGKCGSCPHIHQPYQQQLERKQAQLQQIFPQLTLAEPQASSITQFRNKAKMVVMGTSLQPVLGILNGDEPVDLTNCQLYPAGFQSAFNHLIEFIRLVRLEPYQLDSRRGELKFILLSYSDLDGWLLRFVLRSQHHLAAIRKHLPALQQQWPELAVVTVNLQPEHKAILEGEQEFVLSSQNMLRQQLNDVVLYLQPQSFFQTNTAVAAALYQTARDWTASLQPTRIWDLFCGVGGFALHLAKPGVQVTGIEISAPAIDCASRAAQERGVQIDFRALDASAFADAAQQAPDLLVVNPPRRGLGPALCQRIDALKPKALLYSSCNPATLARDLQSLPAFQPQRAQLFDMFPHTDHAEVLVLLQRSDI